MRCIKNLKTVQQVHTRKAAILPFNSSEPQARRQN
jgi:hypothetical protein